jgi:hypothetical protein
VVAAELQLISTMRVVCESFANYLLGILSSMEEHTLLYKFPMPRR